MLIRLGVRQFGFRSIRNLSTMSNKRTIKIDSVEPRKYVRKDEGAGQQEDSIDKLSNVTLSNEQVFLKDDIITFVKESIRNYRKGDLPRVYVIKGGAGTGKSVVLNNLFNEIQKMNRKLGDKDLKGTRNYLLVNHPEMIRLYHRIARSFEYLSKKDIERPTSYINQFERDGKKNGGVNDLVIVDEAHLLATCKNAYKKFYGENHLTEIMKTCKVVVIVYDDKQTLRTDQFWEEDSDQGCSLEKILREHSKEHKEYELQEQFRMHIKNSTEDNSDVLEWVKKVCFERKVQPVPRERLDGEFEFKLFDNCQEMYERIVSKNDRYGQCRILSTYDFPYRISGNKEWYVTGRGGFKLRWDKFTPGHHVPWSERDYTIKEVGSVYTIQGFDLNYVGVIVGPSVTIDWAADRVSVNTAVYEDRAGTVKREGIDREKAVETIVLNSLYVLLTRGVRGLYVYVANDTT